MSPKRTRRSGPGVREQHTSWLDLVEVSGPFLSLPVLTKAWPAGLDALDNPVRERLRAEHAEWFDDPAAGRERWVGYVLTELLGWGELLRWTGRHGADRDGSHGDDGEDPGLAEALAADVPEYGERVVPSFALTDPDGGSYRLLGAVYPSGTSLTGRVPGSIWAASPVDRLAHALRHHGVPLGLVTDGRWWILVWAQRNGVTTHAAFDASLWREERDLARAFVSLLRRSRFFGVSDEETLPALLDASLDSQEDITEALGVQVRRAVELLVATMNRADEAARRRGSRGLAEVDAHEIYVGSVTVLMRVVFLLFAEERRLLPSDDELYEAHYSAGRLVDRLRERANAEGEDALEYSTSGWHRLLALFRAVHAGVRAGSLALPAYDGSLFDPDAHPWLEGRFDPADGADTEVLGIDDRTILHVLESVQYVEIRREQRRLSFSTLDVEQIGYVYEGLLGYDTWRAAEVVVGLVGSKPGQEAEVPLADLEENRAAAPDAEALAERLAEAYKDYKIGSAKAVARRLAPATGGAKRGAKGAAESDEREARRLLLAATGNDAALTERLLPFFGVIRRDLRGLPVVIRPGALYVTESPLRRNTGTHYTPRFLAEQVVEGALEPLVYEPGPLQTADHREWKLRSSGEILGLKVADIAMGSAAFLVAACRYLADKLVEAWTTEGDPRVSAPDAYVEPVSGASAESEADPVTIEARRLVIEHCLYGADINAMAVEMAKLSLWLVSMDPRKPFTFLDDRLVTGDSLLGITRLDQLEWMHIDPKRGRKLHEGKPWRFTKSAEALAADIAEPRRRISELGESPDDLAEKRKLLTEADSLGKQARGLADLVVGAALAGAGRPAKVDDLSGEASNLARLAGENPQKNEPRAQNRAREWLNTDRVRGGFARQPLHWPLVFPEVFLDNGGFDAIIGNPPFLGGQRLTGAFGTAYREHLVDAVANGARGSADLIAYFFLRAHDLLNGGGQTGLIATNTVAQGDTREVGLDQIVEDGVEIRQAVKSEPWPSKNVALQYSAVWTSRTALGAGAQHVLDGQIVRGITSALDPRSRVEGQPQPLKANQDIAFQGSNILGLGFTMSPEEAQELIGKDSRNSEVLFSYLNGEDLNSQPDCSASRWVINFHDWPLERAAEYPDCLDRVRRLVKPERDQNKNKQRREIWWRFTRPTVDLYRAIADLGRVLVIAQVSKTVMPTFVANGQVYSHKIVVFASEEATTLTLLSSAPHYWWTIKYSATMRADLSYSPSDVFETFPRPEPTEEMRELGERLYTFRGELMLARDAGLTATYNLVHDPSCTDDDIAELREIHRQIDDAVVRAYGWDDHALARTDGWNELHLDHGFYETRQGIRYTVGPATRQEILDRLLELNHVRYAEEARQGLHGEQARREAWAQADDDGCVASTAGDSTVAAANLADCQREQRLYETHRGQEGLF